MDQPYGGPQEFLRAYGPADFSPASAVAMIFTEDRVLAAWQACQRRGQVSADRLHRGRVAEASEQQTAEDYRFPATIYPHLRALVVACGDNPHHLADLFTEFCA